MALAFLKLFNNTLSIVNQGISRYSKKSSNISTTPSSERAKSTSTTAKAASTTQSQQLPPSSNRKEPIPFDLPLKPILHYDLSKIPNKAGLLLIASPVEYDPKDEFSNSVVLILHHDNEQGTIGLFLNKIKPR